MSIILTVLCNAISTVCTVLDFVHARNIDCLLQSQHQHPFSFHGQTFHSKKKKKLTYFRTKSLPTSSYSQLFYISNVMYPEPFRST